MRRLDEVEAQVLSALERAGAAAHQAKPVARSIRRAEADGLRPVGLGYLPIYLAHLRSGKVNGTARPVAQQPREAVVTVDAMHGFAHPAFDAGIARLEGATRHCGSASMAITRSYSIGVLGHVVEDLAMRGLVALAFTNSPPNMTAWGGRRKVFGTNPIAFAAPRPAAPPLVVDQATTSVTKVALVAAAAEDRPIPEGWAFDADGVPTTDPDKALKGSMQPFGGAKGANVALLVELFAAVLGGGTLSMDVEPYARAEGSPPGVGQFVMAFDPEAFASGFTARLAQLAAAIEDDGAARLPGDRRLAHRTEAERLGIAVDDGIHALLSGRN